MHPITIANGYNDRIKPRSCGASNLKCSVLRSARKYLHKKEREEREVIDLNVVLYPLTRM